MEYYGCIYCAEEIRKSIWIYHDQRIWNWSYILQLCLSSHRNGYICNQQLYHSHIQRKFWIAKCFVEWSWDFNDPFTSISPRTESNWISLQWMILFKTWSLWPQGMEQYQVMILEKQLNIFYRHIYSHIGNKEVVQIEGIQCMSDL